MEAYVGPMLGTWLLETIVSYIYFYFKYQVGPSPGFCIYGIYIADESCWIFASLLEINLREEQCLCRRPHFLDDVVKSS